jgi:hypothetical protein
MLVGRKHLLLALEHLPVRQAIQERDARKNLILPRPEAQGCPIDQAIKGQDPIVDIASNSR